MTPERRMKLMAFADGELSGAEREEVLSWLAADEQAGRFVSELSTLGELVRLGHEGSSDARAIGAFDVADAVMAKTAAAAPAAVVVPFDAARARRQRNIAVAAAGAAVAVLAVAASVLFVVRPAERLATTLASGTSTPAAVQSAETGPGIEIDVEEGRGSKVSVFYLPSESSLTTSVLLWVDESGDD